MKAEGGSGERGRRGGRRVFWFGGGHERCDFGFLLAMGGECEGVEGCTCVAFFRGARGGGGWGFSFFERFVGLAIGL